MNIRYRILNIGEERYILDMGGSSLWRIFFPLLYWMLPVNVYKINDDELLEKIVTPHIEQKNIGWQAALSAFIPLGLGNLIYPFIEYLDLGITSFTSTIILSIIFFLIIAFYFYSNILCGKKLQRQVNLAEYPKEKLWIRPESKMYFFQIASFYFLLVGLSVFFVAAVIQLSNGFMFFATTVFLFLILAVSMATIKVGDTTVRFKGDSLIK